MLSSYSLERKLLFGLHHVAIWLDRGYSLLKEGKQTASCRREVPKQWILLDAELLFNIHMCLLVLSWRALSREKLVALDFNLPFQVLHHFSSGSVSGRKERRSEILICWPNWITRPRHMRIVRCRPGRSRWLPSRVVANFQSTHPLSTQPTVLA